MNSHQIITIVAQHSSLDKACAILEMDKTELRSFLLDSGVKHEPGARWSQDCQDYIDAGFPVQLSLF